MHKLIVILILSLFTSTSFSHQIVNMPDMVLSNGSVIFHFNRSNYRLAVDCQEARLLMLAYNTISKSGDSNLVNFDDNNIFSKDSDYLILEYYGPSAANHIEINTFKLPIRECAVHYYLETNPALIK